jgi:ectoine hydroxylase-related dioxygenase (phytanoyl-CoA dioxygenase family)
VDEDIIYQKWPTFRVHLPNNLAVGAWHTDAEFNHPEGEINFILPITRMFESNTVITESEPGLRDFKQVELEPGELFVFNGNKCMHGNLPNKTGSTRISLDFRVLKKSDYSSEKNKSSITTNTKFVVGEYYERLY